MRSFTRVFLVGSEDVKYYEQHKNTHHSMLDYSRNATFEMDVGTRQVVLLHHSSTRGRSNQRKLFKETNFNLRRLSGPTQPVEYGSAVI